MLSLRHLQLLRLRWLLIDLRLLLLLLSLVRIVIAVVCNLILQALCDGTVHLCLLNSSQNVSVVRIVHLLNKRFKIGFSHTLFFNKILYLIQIKAHFLSLLNKFFLFLKIISWHRHVALVLIILGHS